MELHFYEKYFSTIFYLLVFLSFIILLISNFYLWRKKIKKENPFSRHELYVQNIKNLNITKYLISDIFLLSYYE